MMTKWIAVAGMLICVGSGSGCAAMADEWKQFKSGMLGASRAEAEPREPEVGAKPASTSTRAAETVPSAFLNSKRKRAKADWSPLLKELYYVSYPSSKSLRSIENPWGERSGAYPGPMDDMSTRLLAAAEVYRYQGVHFDGYLGSEDDGQHLYTAADGKAVAWFGDNEAKTYRAEYQSMPDTLDERCWICVDLPVFSMNLAGFPIRHAMVGHFMEDTDLYLEEGRFPHNYPGDNWFFRRVDNVRLYFRRKQWYSHDTITVAQYFDRSYRPPAPFQPGDIIFMGHYGDRDAKGPFGAAKHSGIVATVDERGMPVTLYNMRTSNQLIDKYTTFIDQWREIKGEKAYFRRFCDRYSIVGHGRIVNRYEPPAEGQPSVEMAREKALGYLGDLREQKKASKGKAAASAANSADAATSKSAVRETIRPTDRDAASTRPVGGASQ
jgi:hypothetical protein